MHPHIGRSLQTLPSRRAPKGACFPIAMATLGGKQHFLQGIALSLCEMLPISGHPGPGAVPAVCRPGSSCHPSASHSCPAVPAAAMTSAGGLRAGAPVQGWRKAWQLPVKAGGGGGDGWRGPKQPACCLLPAPAFTPTRLDGLCDVGNSLP